MTQDKHNALAAARRQGDRAAEAELVTAPRLIYKVVNKGATCRPA